MPGKMGATVTEEKSQLLAAGLVLPMMKVGLIQAVTLDCDLSCAESVDCNTAGLVQAIQSFLHLDLYMFFI